MARPVDWSSRWSVEARLKQLPSLHGIVSTFGSMPDVIGMHGGLPPADSFPFTSFSGGLGRSGSFGGEQQLQALEQQLGQQQQQQLEQQLEQQQGEEEQHHSLEVTDPALVAAAQQYNMNSRGYAPLAAWAQELVVQLHRPATLLPQLCASEEHGQQQQQQQPGGHEQQQQQGQGQQAQEQVLRPPIGMEVVVTQGTSAALDSLFRMLLNPGDPVLLEEYTYAHVVEADLLPMRCELLPVRLDAGGLVPSHLDELMSARAAAGLPLPRVLYTIPTGQNPTGAVMSSERLAEVYALARKWDLVVVEDDAYYWLQYPGGPDDVPGLNLRPGFLSLDVDGRVVRLDTLAKLLGPGFRLGWLAGPPQLAAKFALYTAGTSIGANMLSQVMVHQLLAKWGRGGFEDFVRRLQRRYAQQAAVAAQAAAEHLGGLAEWLPACAGMFMWVKLTGPGADSRALAHAVAAERVMVIPGHLMSVPHLEAAARRGLCHVQQQQQQQPAAGKAAAAADAVSVHTDASLAAGQGTGGGGELPPSPHFRLSFVSVGPDAIREGFARLRRAVLATVAPPPPAPLLAPPAAVMVAAAPLAPAAAAAAVERPMLEPTTPRAQRPLAAA